MAIMTKADFVIREKNIGRAADSLRLIYDDFPDSLVNEDMLTDSDEMLVCEFFDIFGFYLNPTREDGLIIEEFEDGICGWASFGLLHEVFKAISKAVEPGSFIEFVTDSGDLFRYVFLYDVVEKWSVPHVLFKKKEAI